jgi:multiple sugar transport system permease protein
LRTAINTLVFLVVAINVKMAVALGLSGFFVQSRWWIKILSVLFILPWAVPSDPDHPVGALHAQPRVGRDQQRHLPLTGLDGPNWLNDPTLALGFSMLMHIWKSAAVLDADPAGRAAGHPQ